MNHHISGALLPALFLALATGAIAQKSQDQVGPRPAPASVLPAANDKVTLQFPNTPVSDVLDIYERLVGKPLVRDSQIYRGPNVTLMPPEPITKENACRLIESALLINGYLLLPGPDGSTKVVLSDPKVKQNPLHEGIVVYTDAFELPTGDSIVGYFMRLDFLPPDDAMALLSSHFQLNPYGKITPVYAPPALLITENVSIIKQMIALKPLIDVDPALTAPLERSLKYVAAGDVFPVLINILTDNGVTSAQPVTPGNPLPSQLGNGARPTTNGGITGGRSASSATRGGAFTNAGSTIDADHPDQLTDPSDDISPLSTMVGKTRIVADRQANRIIIMGPPESYDKVNTILDRLDRKPPQVYLATIIGQLTLDNEHDFGVDYLLNFSKLNAALLSSDGLLNTVKDLRLGSLANAVSPLAGLTVFGSITNNFDILARALESDHHFKILSRPIVYAANNKKAMITSGEQIPVPTQIYTSFNSNVPNTSTNIVYRDVVLKLEVVPIINSNKEVTLRIAQINDTVIGQQPINSGTGTTTIPIIGTERLNTTVTIPNHQTIVLGGLITEQTDKQINGVPYLCRVPLLGKLFSSTTNKKVRTELIIFIQPVVVAGEADLRSANRKENYRAQISSDAAEIFPENPLPALDPGDGKSTKPPQ